MTRIRNVVSALVTSAFVTFALESTLAQEPGKYEMPPHIDGKLAYHHHPLLRFVFYEPTSTPNGFPALNGMIVPAKDMGIEWIDGKKKFREVHTHEQYSGRIHAESTDPIKKYKLGDFIELWSRYSGNIGKMVKKTKSEGIVYLFDLNAERGDYYATRLANPADFLEITLDDGRHIVVFLPKKGVADAASEMPGGG